MVQICFHTDQPSDPSDIPDDMRDEADSLNRAILAAIANLRNEVTQLKNDICASIDARIQTVCTELREELATTKKEIQTSITTLEGATTWHEKTIKELEKSASLHSDDVTALQRQVTRLNSEVGKLTEKCENLEGRSRRHNIRIIGVPEGVEGSWPRDFVADLLKDVLSLDEKSLIDRVHRTRCTGEALTLILRLHYYHVLEDILRQASAAKQFSFRGKRIQIFPTILRPWLSEGLYSTVPGSYCATSPASGMAYFTPQDSWSYTMVHRHPSQTLSKLKNTRNDSLVQGHLQLQRIDKSWISGIVFFYLWLAS